MAIATLWNAEWEFCERKPGDDSDGIPQKALWQKIDIPHDWMIYDTHSLYRNSTGWYRKRLQVEKIIPSEEMVLRFDGVYMDTTVFVNEIPVKEWKYGYSTFETEITPFLKEGENWIYVKVVFREPNSRWYSGAGIYRNVWLKKRNRNHIVSDGVYITPVKLNGTSWQITIDTEILLQKGALKSFLLKQYLLDETGKVLAKGVSEPLSARQLSGGNDSIITISQVLGPVENPRLWEIGEGNLYLVRTRLFEEDVLLEETEQKIGFRTMEFLPEKGFLLNGRRVKVNGACEHHDLGALGAAFYKEAARRKFLKLREMGVNAIRTSHNMPAPELMDLADEMGFLIVSEAFDMWEKQKTTYDYARFFNDWYEQDVASWVRRDRNHASLMMWSIGNEIQDILVEKRGLELTRSLRDAVRKQDYRKHAPVTQGSNFMKWENPQKCTDELECAGYNYAEYLYEAHHEIYKDWVIYGSETSSILSSRNIYHFPLEKAILTDVDEQCSALGNSITGWGAKNYLECIGNDRDADFSMGQFIWTGFDYIGESTPYETKNSYFGQIDTAGFPKDSFYIFQAEWTDKKENPMVHIFPYWDFNEGQMIDVQIASNAPEVDLLVNGRSLGRHSIDHRNGRDQLGVWQVPYAKGEITAIAYDETGAEIARKTRRSFGDAKVLKAEANKVVMCSDGQDMIFVEISAYDADGNPVENAKNRVRVEVTGAGRLIGLDNGDSADFDAHKGKSRRLFGGKLLAIIGSRLTPGEIQMTVSSPEIEGCSLTFQSIAGEDACAVTGVSAIEENREYPLYGGGSKGSELSLGEREIPIRKIALTADAVSRLNGKYVLSQDKNEIEVHASLYPVNATYHEITWNAVNDIGIEVNFVKLTPFADGVRVKALGDGEFRLKCYARNGGSAVSVQSELEMTAEGLGRAFLDPYEDVLAGLCDQKSKRTETGIEHGMNFLGGEKGKEEGLIGFTGIDFGDFGSDEITFSIFANTNDPVTFRIYEGDPGEKDSEPLADCFYHKPPRWMVFQDETYRLKRRIRGNASLYITTDDSFQLKSFCFKKQRKAFSRLLATECDSLYGDSYAKLEDKIEKIGNNVSLIFEKMDFGEEGTEKITLNYRSGQSLNPVQIRFTTAKGSSIQVIEAPMQCEYGEQTFCLEKLTGEGKLEFLFLPGSCFDFHWFCFEIKEKGGL